jgi:arsenite methyltransferase
MYFSDVYCDRRLPESVRKHELLWNECIAGAMYTNDFLSLARSIGFTDPRVLTEAPIEVLDPKLKDIVGNARFMSITYRLFKLKDLDAQCEDYGQLAVYNGTVAEDKHKYVLDNHHVFETNKPALVCGNTAAMLQDSWLAPHFTVTGDRSTHYGVFDCSIPTSSLGPSTSVPVTKQTPACGSSCC